MALFKKKYTYYVVYQFKKEHGDVGTGASFVVLNGKVKTIWGVRLLKEKILNLDEDLKDIVIFDWKLICMDISRK